MNQTKIIIHLLKLSGSVNLNNEKPASVQEENFQGCQLQSANLLD